MGQSDYIGYGLESITNYGKLTKDSDGYYSLILGALSVWSGNGVFYRSVDEVKDLFGNGSTLQKRLTAGSVLSEYDHPDINDIEGFNQKDIIAKYMQRLLKIDQNLVTGIFKDVVLVETNEYEPGATRPIILVKGKFKPQGPKNKQVHEALEDETTNCAFSLRCWRRCVDPVEGGGTGKIFDITIPITWDFVPLHDKPGIRFATKHHSIGLESLTTTNSNNDRIHSSDMKISALDDNLLSEQVHKQINPCNGKGCLLGW